MGKCKHRITLGDQKFEFNSDEELNSFLMNNYNRLNAQKVYNNLSKNTQIKFSKDFDKKEENIAKLEAAHASSIQMSTVFTKDGQKDTHVGAGYTGVTRKIEQAREGDRHLIKQYIEAEYIKNNLQAEIALIKRDPNYKNLNDDDLIKAATSILEQRTKNWKMLGVMGSNIHKVAELYFNQDVTDPQILLEMVTDPLELPTMIKYVEALAKLKERIIFDTNDPDVKIMSEVRIHDPNSSVAGILDIVAIDKDGNGHIYDLKTSYKGIDQWNTAKTTKVLYQIAFYEQLLKSVGIPVKALNIVPFELKSIDYDKNILSDIEMTDVVDLGYDYARYPMYRMVASQTIPVSINSLMDVNIGSESIKNQLKDAYGYEVKTGYTNGKEQFIKKSVQQGDDKRKFFIDRYAKNNKVFLTGDELTDNALIEDQLKKQSENANFMINTMSNALDKGIRDEGNGVLKFLPANITHNTSNALLVDKVLSRYTDGSWEQINSATLLSLGLLAMHNIATGVVEFVSITANDLNATIPLSKGKTILGNFVTDSIAFRDNKILKSTGANIEALKVAMFLNENIDTLKSTIPNLTVGEIRIINVNFGQIEGINLEDMLHSYDKLSSYTKVKNNLGQIKHSSYYDLLISRIQIVMSSADTPAGFKTVLEGLHADLTSGDYALNVNDLNILYKDFIEKNKIDSSKFTGATNDFEDVFAHFGLALAQVAGIDVRYEEQIRRIALNNSSQYSAPATIISENIKSQVKLVNNTMYNIGNLHTQYKQTTRDKISKLYDDTNVSQVQRYIVGNNVKAFDNMFIRNSDGSIYEKMRMKNPNDPSNNFTKGEKDFMNMFLDNVNRVRFAGATEEKIAEAQADGAWFDIPLLKANAVSRFHNKDYRTIWKDYYNDALNTYNLFKEDESVVKAKSKEMLEMYLGFSDGEDARNLQISNHGTSEFETNLELVMDTYMFATLRKIEFDKVLPVLNALRISMITKNAGFADKEVKNTEEFMVDYMKMAVYNEKLIEEHLVAPAKILGIVRTFVTNANMAFNPLAGLRNTLQGLWGNASRIISKSYGDDMFGWTEYNKAIAFMVGETGDYVNNVTIVEELNHFYRMSNMDLNAVAERMTSSQTGVMGGKMGMWMNTAPDYFNRMIIFVAQMIKDDCFEAHVMKDGVMSYDFKKDKRFTAYSSGKKSDPDYGKQQGMYLAMLTDFNNTGMYDLKEGDALPAAYTPAQKTSLKTFADSIHGDYDHETKMLATQTFLGMMFFQFKTWLGAKKDQWTLKGGIYHQGSYEHVKNGNGELMYMKEIEGVFTPVTEVTDRPIFEWTGKWQEGILVSLGHMWNEIEFSKFDFKKASELWKNDSRTRSNIKMMAHDLGVFAMLAFIFGFIDWDEIGKSDPFISSTYRALLGSANDLYIGNNIGALLNPKGSMFPAAGYIFQAKTDFWNVITGDMKFTKAVTRNIGTLRPLSYNISNSDD